MQSQILSRKDINKKSAWRGANSKMAVQSSKNGKNNKWPKREVKKSLHHKKMV